MATMFLYARDVQGYPSDATVFSTNLYNVILKSGSALSLTVPASYKVWMMQVTVEPGKSAWIARNKTAQVPSISGVLSQTDSEMASCYYQYHKMVYANDVLSFVSSDTTANLSIAFYALS